MRVVHSMVWCGWAGVALLGGLGCKGLDTASAPAITTFAPAQAGVGTSLVLTGTDFTGATAVTINGVAVTAFSVDSATQITATVPDAASTGDIAVTTNAGTGTSSSAFTVVPAITSLTPNVGPTGTVVTLTGSGFVGTTLVTFGAQSTTAYIATFTVTNANSISATVPADAITGPVYLTASGNTCTGPTFTLQ